MIQSIILQNKAMSELIAGELRDMKLLLKEIEQGIELYGKR